MVSKGPRATSRHGKKLAKRKLAEFTARLLTKDGHQLESAQIASAYKEIYRNPTSALYSAYPHIFPAYVPALGISSLESIALDASKVTPRDIATLPSGRPLTPVFVMDDGGGNRTTTRTRPCPYPYPYPYPYPCPCPYP